MPKYRITNIAHVTDGAECDISELTIEVDHPEDADETEVAAILSEEVSEATGFLHDGFSYEKVEGGE